MPSLLSREKCAEHKKSDSVTEPPCSAVNGRRWVGAVAVKARHRFAFQPEIRRIVARVTMTAFQGISHSLRQLYLEDERPWLVGGNSSAELWSAAACCRFFPASLLSVI